VGTNALALSLKTQQSSCVFSNEHFMSSVHDWVCYASPIIDPYSKQVLGVIDLSTTWNHHNSLGLLAAERCASIIQSALLEFQQQHLFIRAFAVPQVLFNGKIVVLTPRQIEILTILALCPQGMNLENLHQALYGERKVSVGTLKAEMSQLRDILGACWVHGLIVYWHMLKQISCKQRML
jgi:transcriptional regulator of acetoin/glycerol metabolism